jgi:tetratricopeptide (TPR) repeat protein
MNTALPADMAALPPGPSESHSLLSVRAKPLFRRRSQRVPKRRTLVSLLAPAVLALLVSGFALAAEPADELIKKGDVFYSKLQPTEALKYYLPAEELDPANVPLLVRIARQYRHLQTECCRKEDKAKWAGMAVSYANRAVKLAPEDPEAQLAVAVSYGKLLPFESIKEQLTCSKTIKAAAEKCIQLDPRGDLPWQVLGRYYFNYADISPVKRALGNMRYGNIPTATFEEAAKCFEKAIELNPNRLMHFIELGCTYAKMNRTAEAKKMITKGLAMTETEKDDPEVKQKGREVLKSL